mgnify:CR=1 FL=1
MKKQHLHIKDFEHISREKAASLKGGNDDEGEYIIIYIDGVPHKVKINKNGQQISEPERI